ncbi:MAG: NADH-quinone oxidoreductase subunit J [Thermoleophilia bacterium]|nr:NADH-quinone oxidoreductase subunit J [Thermoleophilia bacterium]
MGERITFAIAAATALVCSIAVISVRDAFRAAVALIGALLSVAVIFVLLSAPFVAMIQVVVYAGAIVVLFLFVIAYLGERRTVGAPDRLARWQFLSWVAVLTLGALAVIAFFNSDLAGFRDDPRPTGNIGDPDAIGAAFLDRYLIPFEVTSLVLLVAAVGAVLLARRAVQREGGR